VPLHENEPLHEPLHDDSAVRAGIPRPEHPRPDFKREPWLNLNGRWRFTFDPHNVGEQKRWYRLPYPQASHAQGDAPTSLLLASSGQGGDGVTLPAIEDPFGLEIVVPFPWESRLSGLSAKEYKGAAWYQRSIEIPADWAETPSGEGRPQWRLKPYLCFGAVDWQARVWVNGRFAGEHSGGYTPFSLDISRFAQPGQPATVTVRAYDACDADTLLGKQTYDWYTPSSGIWQTVWLEGRAGAYLSRLHLTPRLEEGKAILNVTVDADESATGKPYRLSVTSADGSFPEVTQGVVLEGAKTEAVLEVPVPSPRAWSPETPHLYDCSVLLEAEDGSSAADVVTSYFGLRTISRGRWENNPYEYVFLNGEPVYLRGALDQALHPDGLHGYPSDDAIRADVQTAKDLGLNMLRCHIKVNEPRYYYWADRLGVLMMYDLPSASVYTPSARANWERTFREALARDLSHPCIFSWILFNETWGLEEHQTSASWAWVAAMFDLAKELDPSRLVEDNSACLYDHVKTDLNTWHFYISDYDRARREVSRIVAQTYEGSPFNYVGHRYGHLEGATAYKQGTEPLLNSEYAGLGASGGDKDIAYTFKFLTTELRRHPMVCGYVYTELADIEWEHNGFINYDRSEKEFGYESFFPEMQVADLNGADFVGLDCPPCQTLPPGSLFSAPAFISHWDNAGALRDARLCWRITITDRFGETRELAEGERKVQARRYSVTDAGRIEAQLPDEPGLVTVALWLKDGEGSVRARNYVNVDVYDPQAVPEAERTARGYALRFKPGDFSDASWPQPSLGPRAGKFGASGAGWVEYTLALPDDLEAAAVEGLRLVFEAGARTASRRLGWRDRPHGRTGNYPQTEALTLPTDLVVTVNGVQLSDSVRLPDDPADARGVLSAHLSPNFEYASYGFLTTLEADAKTARRILAASADGKLAVRFEIPQNAVKRGGLNLYGARMGAFPLDPTVLLDTSR
jgi:hypothetical protein